MKFLTHFFLITVCFTPTPSPTFPEQSYSGFQEEEKLKRSSLHVYLVICDFPEDLEVSLQGLNSVCLPPWLTHHIASSAKHLSGHTDP